MSGEVEQLLLERYHAYGEAGDPIQESRYLRLLFHFRDVQQDGLIDETPSQTSEASAPAKEIILPPLTTPAGIELAARFREIFGPLPDEMGHVAARRHFEPFKSKFDRHDRAVLTRGFNVSFRALTDKMYSQGVVLQFSLGEMRRLLITDMLAQTNISAERALIFLHGIQKDPEVV